jgi:ribosomal protein S14
MNKNTRNIIKEKIKRTMLFKKNIFIRILKSISQNNNITNKLKIYANYNTDKKTTKNTMQTRKHKICLLTGKRSGVLNGFSFSRYKIKNLIIANKYTNLKKHNW